MNNNSDTDILVPIREIVAVEILDTNSEHSPFLDRLPEVLPDKSKVYVSFHHLGKTRGETIPFESRQKTYANLPLVANQEGLEDPLVCTIKEKRGNILGFLPFVSDRTLFKAEISLKDDVVNPTTKMGSIVGNIMDLNGKNTGIQIKIQTFSTEWEHHYTTIASSTNVKEGKMDLYLRIFLGLLKKQIAVMNLGIDTLKTPQQAANPQLPTIKLLPKKNSSEYLIVVPAEDEFLEPPVSARMLPLMNKLLPNNKRVTCLYDRARTCNDVRKILGANVLTPHEGRWARPNSDESMTRVFFSSLGGYVLELDQETGGYKADMDFLSDYEYKKDLEKLGCTVYFDADGKIAAIRDTDEHKTVYTPDSPMFEWAKLKARSAVFVYASLLHITNYHFNWASTPGMAIRKFLGPTHPIRMALTIHFFRTHYTCSKAEHSLLSERGVLGRTLPFEYDLGLKKAYETLLEGFQFERYPDEIARRGMTNCSMFIGATDGLLLHTVMNDYSSNLFDETYEGSEELFQKDIAMKNVFDFLVKELNISGSTQDYTMDNMKMIWGEILFRVTGDHSMSK